MLHCTLWHSVQITQRSKKPQAWLASKHMPNEQAAAPHEQGSNAARGLLGRQNGRACALRPRCAAGSHLCCIAASGHMLILTCSHSGRHSGQGWRGSRGCRRWHHRRGQRLQLRLQQPHLLLRAWCPPGVSSSPGSAAYHAHSAGSCVCSSCLCSCTSGIFAASLCAPKAQNR